MWGLCVRGKTRLPSKSSSARSAGPIPTTRTILHKFSGSVAELARVRTARSLVVAAPVWRANIGYWQTLSSDDNRTECCQAECDCRKHRTRTSWPRMDEYRNQQQNDKSDISKAQKK